MNTIKLDTKGLDNLIKELKEDKYKVKVGVLGGQQESEEGEEKVNLAYIGMIQEFGSVKNKIPKRSFIREPLQKHLKKQVEKQKERIKNLLFKDPKNKIDIKKAYELLGVIAERIIKISFRTKNDRQWAPNAPATIKIKKVDNPLIWTGRLSKSIDYEVIKK